jgi:hypothetical protein
MIGRDVDESMVGKEGPGSATLLGTVSQIEDSRWQLRFARTGTDVVRL